MSDVPAIGSGVDAACVLQSFRTPFSRLANVELQLVMQCLDQQSLIRFARCDKDTLATASLPFAWSALPLLRIDVQRAELGVSQWLDSPLLRHTATSLRLGYVSGMDRQMAWLTRQVHALPRLRALHSTLMHEVDRLLPGLFGQPVFPLAGLRSLYVRDDIGSQLVRTLATYCPHLSTLHVHLPRAAPAYPGAFLGLLSQMAQLTDLHVDCGGSPHNVPVLMQVANCRTLRCLSLANLHGSAWAALPSSPALQSLRLLRITERCAQPGGLKGREEPHIPIDWNACFAALRGLRTVELHMASEFGQLLEPIVAHCTKLRRLLIRPVLEPQLDLYDVPVRSADGHLASITSWAANVSVLALLSDGLLSRRLTRNQTECVFEVCPLAAFVEWVSTRMRGTWPDQDPASLTRDEAQATAAWSEVTQAVRARADQDKRVQLRVQLPWTEQLL
jgi:hypothetical protein